MTHPLFSYGGQITPFVVMGAQTLILFLSLLTPDFDMSQPLGLVRFGVGGATCIAFVGEVSERWLIRIGGDPKGQYALPGVVYLQLSSPPVDRDTRLSSLPARCGVVEWAGEQGGSGPSSSAFLLPVLVNTNTGFSDH